MFDDEKEAMEEEEKKADDEKEAMEEDDVTDIPIDVDENKVLEKVKEFDDAEVGHWWNLMPAIKTGWDAVLGCGKYSYDTICNTVGWISDIAKENIAQATLYAQTYYLKQEILKRIEKLIGIYKSFCINVDPDSPEKYIPFSQFKDKLDSYITELSSRAEELEITYGQLYGMADKLHLDITKYKTHGEGDFNTKISRAKTGLLNRTFTFRGTEAVINLVCNEINLLKRMGLEDLFAGIQGDDKVKRLKMLRAIINGYSEKELDRAQICAIAREVGLGNIIPAGLEESAATATVAETPSSSGDDDDDDNNN